VAFSSSCIHAWGPRWEQGPEDRQGTERLMDAALASVCCGCMGLRAGTTWEPTLLSSLSCIQKNSRRLATYARARGGEKEKRVARSSAQSCPLVFFAEEKSGAQEMAARWDDGTGARLRVGWVCCTPVAPTLSR